MSVDFNHLSWLERAIAPLREVRVAVLGDFCLDAYWHLDTGEREFSVETGSPVQRVRNQRYSLGGAGNVVANLIGLGVGSVQAIGVVGTDFFGRELLRLLDDLGVETRNGMVLDEHWQTMVYAKPCYGEKEEARIDFGAFNVLTEEIVDSLIDALKKAAAENDVIVLNQQIPRGVSSLTVIERINNAIENHRDTHLVVDARHRPDLYRGAVLKLNTREAARFLGESVEDSISTERAKDFARRISKHTGKPTFLTRGELGILVANGEDIQEIPGIQILEKTDSVGAGDTV